MNDPLEFARANGYAELWQRLGGAVYRRGRDRLTARRLKAPGFRAGGSPRLLGLSHIQIGPDFNAGDALWLEAVLRYGAGHSEQHFSPQLRIGKSARLSDSVHIACLREITIGDHLLCGSGVLITDHAHGRYDGPGGSDPETPPASRPLHSAAPVHIGRNVWLGDGVAVLPGAEIGDGCVIGANSVVTGAVAAGTIAVGSPARPLRRWDALSGVWMPIATAERP